MSFRTAAALLALGLAVAASAQSTYLALGDSVAFGLHKDPNGPGGYNGFSNGDRGYVSVVADRIGAVDGIRPAVTNYAIPGETSTSFLDDSIGYRYANTNYTFLTDTDSQEQKLEAYLARPGEVGTVSFAIGANDFLSLDGSLQTDPSALAAAFASIQVRYDAVLTAVQADSPHARLLLPGYYNPYALTDPKHIQAALVIGQLDALIQGEAVKYGGRYVDFYDVIEGHQDTLLYPGDIHPNDAGYLALGQAAAAQVVPEPGTWAALGLSALALARRRRR